MTAPILTIIIPVYNERANIEKAISRIYEKVTVPYSINIIYDFPEDNTLPEIEKISNKLNISMKCIRNKFGKGVLNAIKTGLDGVSTRFAIVTMADLSDPPDVINDMVKKAIKEEADIVCGSRYMKDGRQIGGPFIKGLLSRYAGLSLYYLTSLPVHDVTNSFKLYSRRALETITIESSGGFELGMELVVKAHFAGLKVCEVPTIWQDRSEGQSRFKLFKWLPKYLRWYMFAIRHDCLARLTTIKKWASTSTN